ncbi:MAG: hypothetical protein ACKOYM_02185 [Actinomycetes bacterium]
MSGRGGAVLGRVAVLVLLLMVSGVMIGLVFAYPVSRVQLSRPAAIRLEQAALAGKIDPDQALATPADFDGGWVDGDASLGKFGLLGARFCGNAVELPDALSPVRSAVLRNESADATLIVQAVRADRWQNAREYVSAVDRAVTGCDRFYLTGPEGRKLQRVLDAGGAKPIDDYASRVYLSEDGTSAIAWSTMAVGDVIVAIEYLGPTRPPEGFLGELESKLLLRMAPEVFAPGGVAPESTSTTTTTPAETPSTTVVAGGSADESSGGD